MRYFRFLLVGSFLVFVSACTSLVIPTPGSVTSTFIPAPRSSATFVALPSAPPSHTSSPTPFPMTLIHPTPTHVSNDGHWLSMFGPGNGLNGTVNALVVDHQDNLYVGGDFTLAGVIAARHIAKWDGTTWTALGSGLNGSVNSLVLGSQGNFYASGDFTVAGGQPANHIACWNGATWSALGGGVDGRLVNLVTDQQGNLYVGVIVAGEKSPFRIAKWNGVTWNIWNSNKLDTWNGAFLVGDSQGILYTGGRDEVVAKWDGASWATLGDEMYAQTLFVDNHDNLYGANRASVAKWDGVAWKAVGDLGTIMGDAMIFAMAKDSQGNLYVGGGVSGDGPNIFRWDGDSWVALGHRLDNCVFALAIDSRGNLYAGGNFTVVDTVPSSNLAKWQVTDK